ncbi:MAG TPA: c-type cytochrome [Vicinamibacterales bacterium]
MANAGKAIGLVLAVAAVAIGLVLGYARVTGLTAQGTPGRVETAVARMARSWAIPASYRERASPVARTEEAVRAGLAHFADHCASCHGNDGSGNTEMGRNLFPPSPDMRLAATQDLTDGELFYIVEHGIRFTGMPAWSTGTAEGEEASWQLVHFLRRLPQLTAGEIEQMAAMNPRPPEEIRQEIEEQRFLEGK